WREHCGWLDRKIECKQIRARVLGRFLEVWVYSRDDVQEIGARSLAGGIDAVQAMRKYQFDEEKLRRLARKDPALKVRRGGHGRASLYSDDHLAEQFAKERSAGVPAGEIVIRDAARRFKLTERQLRLMIDRGELPATKRPVRVKSRWKGKTTVQKVWCIPVAKLNDARSGSPPSREYVSPTQAVKEYGKGFRVTTMEAFRRWFKAGRHPCGQEIETRETPDGRLLGSRKDLAAALERYQSNLTGGDATWLTLRQAARRTNTHHDTLLKWLKREGAKLVPEMRADPRGIRRKQLMVAWPDVLRALGKAPESNGHPTAEVPSPAEFVSANEDRDRWMYEQRLKLTPWKVIHVELNRIAADRGWEALDSPQACLITVGRFWRRHGLKPPPAGKPGRPKKGNNAK
ncbi:MAG: hypothetical protein KY475_23300, partial [Planctomycetes bacterium]|nr:hypothetical protein [Planctomycetota bacterium]